MSEQGRARIALLVYLVVVAILLLMAWPAPGAADPGRYSDPAVAGQYPAP